MRVWVTRAEPGAQSSARRLVELGHEPVVAPLLQSSPLPIDPDLSGVDALAFTSVRSPSLFVAAAPQSRGLPVFTVGDATAEAARAAGYGSVRSAQGAIGDLARLLRAEFKAGLVLVPGAREPAGDLAGELADTGITVRLLPIYETQVVLGPPPWDPMDAVLIHSPKAARRLADLTMAHTGLTDMTVYALSNACAEPLRAVGYTRIVVAQSPQEDALMAHLAG